MLFEFQLKRMKHRFTGQFKEEINEILSEYGYLLIVWAWLYRINIYNQP